MLEVLGEVVGEAIIEAAIEAENVLEKVSESAVKIAEASHLSDELKLLKHLRPENMLKQTLENIQNGEFAFSDLRDFRPVSDCSSLLSKVEHIRSKGMLSIAAETRKDAMLANSMSEFIEKHKDANRLSQKALSARKNEKMLNHFHGFERMLKEQIAQKEKARYAHHV